MNRFKQWPRASRLWLNRWWRHHPESKIVVALCLTVAALGRLSQWDVPSSHLTRWHGKALPAVSERVERAPASTPSCLEQRYQVDALKQDSAELTARFPQSNPHSGRWQHFDLAKLSFPMASFLREIPASDFLALAPQIKACRDIPCLYNQALQDRTGESGQLVWNWYLRTGIIPRWRRDAPALSVSELRALWFVANRLPREFFHQDHTRFVEKVPRLGSCAAHAGRSLLLSAHCAPSQMSDVAYVQPLTEALLVPFQNSQARAHQMASFIWSPAALESAGPQVYSYLKESFFKRDWTVQGELDEEFTAAQWSWRDLKRRRLRDCLDLHQTALHKQLFGRSIASLAEVHPIVSCLRASAEGPFKRHLSRRMTQEHPRACEFHAPGDSGKSIADQFLERWDLLVNKDLDQLEWALRAQGLKWLHDFESVEEALAKTDPTWVYFQCQAASDRRGCYHQGLRNLIGRHAEVSPQIVDDVLDTYPYESLHGRLLPELGPQRLWFAARLADAATGEWVKCWQQGTYEIGRLHQKLRFVDYRPGQTDARFSLCLEAASQRLFDQVLALEPAEQSYWRKDLVPHMKRFWRERMAYAKHEESERLRRSFPHIAKELRRDLVSWMSKDPNFDPQGLCRIRLTYHYPSGLYFHGRDSLNHEFGALLCQEAIAAPEVQRVLGEHQRKRGLKLAGELRVSMGPRFARYVRAHCLGRTPASHLPSLLETPHFQACIHDQFDVAWKATQVEFAEKRRLPPQASAVYREGLEQSSTEMLKSNL